jgi:hypothetical protein
MKKIMPSASNLYCYCVGKRLSWLLALFVALAVAPPTLLAQVPDPTGAWLIQTNLIGPDIAVGTFQLIAFHKGGTLTQDIQGESAFAPHATTKPKVPFNVITSPQTGVWQKTGFNTFAATLIAMEYQVVTKPPSSPLFRFDKAQYTGRLNQSGDGMGIDIVTTFFGLDGTQQNPDGTPGTDEFDFKANGVRIALEIVPNSVHQLPIPPIPQ